jgi:hypothetical protein
MRINTSKVRLVKSSLVDCELLLIAPYLFFVSFFKGLHALGFFDQSYDFSRKSLSKYFMDTIDFNKHDIDIFINLTKIVRYGRHWDDTILLTIYFDGNFPNAKLRPYDDYKNMSTLNTYCGILSTCHNYKKNIIVDWILCPGEIKDYSTQSKQNSIIRWLACNM